MIRATKFALATNLMLTGFLLFFYICSHFRTRMRRFMIFKFLS